LFFKREEKKGESDDSRQLQRGVGIFRKKGGERKETFCRDKKKKRKKNGSYGRRPLFSRLKERS